MKTILVIGATGLIGKAIAKQLRTDGYHVRILTRNKEKAATLFHKEFEITEGDVLKSDTLIEAFAGIQAVYINLPDKIAPATLPGILELCKKNNIEQIAYTSGCTVRKENAVHPMIKAHYEAENLIINSGLAYSIFRPTMILDTLPMYANKGKPFIIGDQPHKWSWVYTGDIAKMVSKAFGTEKAKNTKFTIWGPDKYTFAEAIDLFNNEFYPGSKKAKSMPVWLAKIIAFFVGSKLKYAISIFTYFTTHAEEGDPKEANSLLGAPGTGLNEFIEIYRSTISKN
jgi:uncharacterized protein YbjT (DUF2867 family)